ncbi:IS5 family transposase [Massilia antarctica]|uniref:IS5 family transposase n=1 Tax=Massilia antarctica TaxID=2765360 RepID=A0AA49A757_9BURK|nr:IS5 family transposase [Massilia antarctica]
MAQALLPEDLWPLMEAHLPTHSRSPKGGRPRINDHATLTGILFVLRTGLPREYLPRELGCGIGMTCWRRLHKWMRAGVWQSVHEAVLRRLQEYDQIMSDRACIDAASVPAPAGGEHTGRNPTDRGKLGCKHHVLVDQRGLPLAAQITGAQVHDSRMLIPLPESIPAVKGLSGRARKRPGKLHADRACASRAHWAWLRRRGISARIAGYGVESRERLGRWRWHTRPMTVSCWCFRSKAVFRTLDGIGAAYAQNTNRILLGFQGRAAQRPSSRIGVSVRNRC